MLRIYNKYVKNKKINIYLTHLLINKNMFIMLLKKLIHV